MTATGNESVSLAQLKSAIDNVTDNATIGTITGITSTSPIVGSGTSGSVALSHASSGVTAGSYGPSSSTSPGSGGTFNVPYVTVDSTGHVTSASSRTITLPTSTSNSGTITGITTTSPLSGSGTSGSVALSHASSGVTAASYGPSANTSPGSAGTFTVPQITVNATGHVTSASSRTITMPTVGNGLSAVGGITRYLSSNQSITSSSTNTQVNLGGNLTGATGGVDINYTISTGTGYITVTLGNVTTGVLIHGGVTFSGLSDGYQGVAGVYTSTSSTFSSSATLIGQAFVVGANSGILTATLPPIFLGKSYWSTTQIFVFLVARAGMACTIRGGSSPAETYLTVVTF